MTAEIKRSQLLRIFMRVSDELTPRQIGCVYRQYIIIIIVNITYGKIEESKQE